MDATKWTQGFQEMIGVKPMEQNGISTAPSSSTTRANNKVTTERKTRPQEKVNCPRCNSTNTKFCYYNNYSLTQPRYFCKACRRYWTEGGSLRNVPVGGSSRKHKRGSSSSLSSAAVAINVSSLGLTNKLPDLNPPITQNKEPKDLNFFSFPVMQDAQNNFPHQFLHQIPRIETTHQNINPNSAISPFEILRSTGVGSRGLDHNFILPAAGQQMLDPSSFYSSGFPIVMQDYKQSNNLSFSSDGIGNNNNNNAVQESGDHVNGSRVLFPYGDMKQFSSTGQDQQKIISQAGNSNTAYWNGMFSAAGGTSW